ncbi:hypothetical protein C8J56DRAFT_68664 [Mycena floridula]|nr:hypothetical protein C8J56DRAFT_68664 [Mycena floridula]
MSPPTAAQVYNSSLLGKGHGCPLWLPEPDDGLLEEYRRTGVQIGDLLRLTADGGYEYFFNIFQSASHAINVGRVPAGFRKLSLNKKDISERKNQHQVGAHLSTMIVTKIAVSAEAETGDAALAVSGIPMDFGAGIEFTSSSKSGATLVLPDGASRSGYENHTILRDYIAQNIQSWFAYVNGTRGREASHLCLVTGCDKARSWAVASFSSADTPTKVSLTFKATVVGAAASYSWHEVNSAATRVSREPEKKENQCVFVRGYNLNQRIIPFRSERITSDVPQVSWKRPSWLARLFRRSSSRLSQSSSSPPDGEDEDEDAGGDNGDGEDGDRDGGGDDGDGEDGDGDGGGDDGGGEDGGGSSLSPSLPPFDPNANEVSIM